MKFIVPVPITAATLTASNIAESVTGTPATDVVGVTTITPPVWSSTATYAIGDYCILTSTHKIYQCQVACTGSQPDLNLTGTLPKWEEISSTNRWRMFDAFGSTQSQKNDNIDVAITLSTPIDTIALIGLSGVSAIAITVNNAIGDAAVDTVITVTNKTDYIFSGFAQTFAGDSLNIVLIGATPATLVKISKLEIGNAFELGDINYGSTVGIIDYSLKKTDPWGNTTLTKRPFTKRITAKLIINNANLDVVNKRLSAFRATPVVWIGKDNLYTSLIVYGFYRDFDINISYPMESDCLLSIEGFN